MTLTAATLLLVSGCERKEQDVPQPTHPTYTVDVDLAVVFMYGSHEYEIGSEYTDDLGVHFKIDRFKFLLSNSYIVDDAGVTLGTYPGKVLSVDASLGMNTFSLGPLTASHAHFVHWVLGLDPAANHVAPAEAAAPLDQADLRCGPDASDGYRFLELEGRWDSSGDGAIGNDDATFAYRVCGDPWARPASSRIHGDLPPGGMMLVPVRVDMKVLLNGVDLTTAPGLITDGPVIETMMTNLVAALATDH
jgi:hypothetical protein